MLWNIFFSYRAPLKDHLNAHSIQNILSSLHFLLHLLNSIFDRVFGIEGFSYTANDLFMIMKKSECCLPVTIKTKVMNE